MKKMRRLIPAVAMLMVAAVMLSTASFAWFTMNEEVTASGMQIQAKASGSLLISEKPFTDSNLGGTDVTISENIHSLLPMAYKGVDTATLNGNNGITENGWYKPADNKNSNTITGANDGAYEAIKAWDSQYQFKKEFYIATAGETFKATSFDIVLTAPVCPATGETHKAYAAAIYVVTADDTAAWAVGGDVEVTKAPNAILYVGESTVPAKADAETRNKIGLKDVTIPSIVGASASNKVGVKVIVHFYVDGALQSTEKVTVNNGFEYAKATGKFVAGTSYYTFVAVDTKDFDVSTDVDSYYVLKDSKYVPATGKYVSGTPYFSISAATIVEGDDKLEDISGKNWYTASVAITEKVDYCYIRTADVQSNGSTLKLAFSAEIPTNP